MPIYRITVVALMLLLAVASMAAEATRPKPFVPLRTLYVSPHGNDKNSGLGPDRPFRTISQACTALQPGDLLLVSGGTYAEHVHVVRAGTAEHPIMIRAAPGETPFVMGGHIPVGWTKTPGTRFTYSTAYTRPAQYVWEDRAVIRYMEVKDPGTLEASPGSYLFDRKNHRLSVHPLRGSSPEQARIVVTDAKGYVDEDGGARPHDNEYYFHGKGILIKAPYNRVEGFTVAYFRYGIQIRGRFCEVRHNTVYGCGTGVSVIYSQERNIVADNHIFLNDWNGIHAGKSKTTLIRNNLLRYNNPHGPYGECIGNGVHHSMQMYYPVDPILEGNTVIATRHLMRYKGSSGTYVLSENVFVGGDGNVEWGKGSEFTNNTVVGGALRDRDHTQKDAVITPESAKKHNAEKQDHATVRGNLYLSKSGASEACFADPVRYDYRLRQDSPHLGKGVSADAAPVRYVSPDGSDQSDGRTPKRAWKTLAQAASAATAGDTVYIMPGVYEGGITMSVKGTMEKPIAFKTYRRGRVVLDGRGQAAYGLLLKGAAHFTLDGFIFKSFTEAAIRIEGDEKITLIENVFDGAAVGVSVRDARDVRVQNNTIVRCATGIAARTSGRLVLRNNLFAETAATLVAPDPRARPQIVSERNGFAGPDAKARLADWRKTVRETHPSLLAETILSPDGYLLPAGDTLASAGLGHRPIGARNAAKPANTRIPIEGFRVAVAHPRQAVLIWATPWDYADARVSWRQIAGAREKTLPVPQVGILKLAQRTVRLTGLQMGVEYRARLVVSTPDGRTGQAELTFTTPKALRAPATLYVSPSGDDANDGRSPKQPFRTLAAASFAAVPGDTVLVGPGVYPETLTLWCGGLSKEKHLVFRSAQRGKAVIDCSKPRALAIFSQKVRHVTIDGFAFSELTQGAGGCIRFERAVDIRIVNNIFRRIVPRGYSSTELIMVYMGEDVVIRDNLFKTGWNSVQLGSSRRVTIDHNTFWRAGISAVNISGGPKDDQIRVTNNIFVDVCAPKKDNAAINIRPHSTNVVCDHNLFWRKTSPHMSLFGFRETPDGKYIPWQRQDARTIEEMVKKFGLGRRSLVADPQFRNPDKGDFTLKPTSPAIGMGENGGNVGMRNPPSASE